jgi:hypothetical protein
MDLGERFEACGAWGEVVWKKGFFGLLIQMLSLCFNVSYVIACLSPVLRK